jgi:magnesium transporter
VEALSGRGADAAPPAPAPPRPALSVLACGPHEITESPVREAELLGAMRGRWPVLWVHAAGMGDAATLEGLRAVFGFPAEVADRLLDPHARAGVERHDAHLLALAPFGAGADGADLGRAAVLAGPDHLVTFQAAPGDRFAALREALRSPYSRLRAGPSGAVALAALEPLLGALADAAAGSARRVDGMESTIAGALPPQALADLHALRRELRAVERALAPLPPSLLAAAADPAPLPAEGSTRLRLLAERVDGALESVGAARESAAALGEACLAAAQARLEARVRTLTLLLPGLALLLLATVWLLAR